MEGCIGQSGDGVIIFLRVIPSSVRNEISFSSSFSVEEFRVKVKSPAYNNKANKELLSFLSKLLGVSKDSISIKSGLRGRRKSVLVKGIDFKDIKDRLKVFL